jgi:tRNA pseudouridine55 synthase
LTLPFVRDVRAADFASGALLLIDKPKGWTSFDAVNRIRGILRRKYNQKNFKVGHSGTLDPMATGLLLICTGKWTKELQHLTGMDKTYKAVITLGVETDSYDAEGKVLYEKEVPGIPLDALQSILQSFTGDILQYPPAFSAIKKDGKPLYALARAGKEVKTEPRPVKVYDIQFLEYTPPVLHLKVHCGSGFYVRSLAHDIGEKLDCGAHLSGLVRLTVGPYHLDDALSVDQFIEAFKE